MPLVVFESRLPLPPIEADCPEGGRLLDVCDELAVAPNASPGRVAPVPFSCRGATCGSCRVDVIEGTDVLEPPSANEQETLAVFGDDPTRRRLACQLRMLPGRGVVRIRAV
jgi:ferredoxin